MTNKEFYGENLQIVIDGDHYASIYNRHDPDMELLVNFVDNDVLDNVINWLHQEYDGTIIYKYKENM